MHSLYLIEICPPIIYFPSSIISFSYLHSRNHVNKWANKTFCNCSVVQPSVSAEFVWVGTSESKPLIIFVFLAVKQRNEFTWPPNSWAAHADFFESFTGRCHSARLLFFSCFQQHAQNWIPCKRRNYLLDIAVMNSVCYREPWSSNECYQC